MEGPGELGVTGVAAMVECIVVARSGRARRGVAFSSKSRNRVGAVTLHYNKVSISEQNQGKKIPQPLAYCD